MVEGGMRWRCVSGFFAGPPAYVLDIKVVDSLASV